MTLETWVATWIERRSIRLAPSTISGYRRMLSKYITPSLCGRLELEQVKPEDLIDLLSPLVARGFTRAAQLLQILVGAALKAARKRGLISSNPMDEVDRIEHDTRETAWLTEEEAIALIDAAPEPYRLAFMLAMCCGLRRGEIMGLHWQDVDLTHGILHVCRQRMRIDGQIIEKRPKSRASIRPLPLAPEMLDILQTHFADRRGEYVISQDSGAPMTEKRLRCALRSSLRAAGLPAVTLHGLRHTMAATAATEGIPIKTLQLLMGHAQFTTTANIYAHVDRKSLQKAANVVSLATLRGGAHDWKSCNG